MNEGKEMSQELNCLSNRQGNTDLTKGKFTPQMKMSFNQTFKAESVNLQETT